MTSPIAEALATLPDLTGDQRRDLEYKIAWSWAVVLRYNPLLRPTVHRFREERSARTAFGGLDVPRGWAILFDPEGRVVSRRDGVPL